MLFNDVFYLQHFIVQMQDSMRILSPFQYIPIDCINSLSAINFSPATTKSMKIHVPIP